MADISDVEAALAAEVAGILYPAGPDGASALAGLAARVYRGWPQEAALDADLAAGVLTVTVNHRAGYFRELPRLQGRECIAAENPPTITCFVESDSAAFGGAAAAGQVVGIAGAGVRHAERVRADDTLESLAQRIAAALPGASAEGATLHLPGLAEVRIMADAAVARETRRQEAQFTVTLWAPSREARDAAGSLIDGALSDVRSLPLPDGTSADRLRPAGDRSDDGAQEAGLYKREFIYACEYSITRARQAPRVLFQTNTIRAQGVAVRTVTL